MVDHNISWLDSQSWTADEAPVFVATVDNGDYLRAYYGAAELEKERPITGAAMSQALKRSARRAGLDPEGISLHSLRHLGAELFQEASKDVQQTQHFLDHAQLNTTQIYLTQLTGEEHESKEPIFRTIQKWTLHLGPIKRRKKICWWSTSSRNHPLFNSECKL